MTAPDPTAGERERCTLCGPGYRIGDDGCRHTPAPSPDAAASTGTSEDVEALAREVCVCTGNHDPARRIECDYALAAAKRALASDWLAAREAAARAEEREQIARKSERLRRENPMNGDGANHMLDQVQRLLDAPEAVADERRTIHAERAEAYERLEAENAARRVGEAGTR